MKALTTKTRRHKAEYFVYPLCLGVLVVIALVLQGSGGRTAELPNVIFIGVDTLRADRLEGYGYSKIKTPHINRLAQDGVRFENAIAQVPLTLPSFCSIMTGTYPLFHGVRDFSYGFLPPDKTTLAELLKSRGYTTAAFIGAFVLDTRFGLNQGFDYYDGNFDLNKYRGVDPGTIQRRGDHVVEQALKWMQANRDSTFFAWIHLYDPHHPFEPPEPYRSQYRENPYDGEVAYTDALVGEIVNFLKSQGLYDPSLIVFTSDHGESLGEHQEQNHGFFIYDASLRVPLIVKTPGGSPRGKVVQVQVRTIDILPTVLQYASVPRSQEVQGVGLRSLVEGKASRISEPYAYSESYYAHSSFGWSPLRSLRTNRYKYVMAPRPELYDLEKDPLEQNNVYAENRAVANRFRQDLERLEQLYAPKSEAAANKPGELDPGVIETLKSLGYVAIADQRRTDGQIDYSKLADPKDKIQLFNLYLEAQDYSQVGKHEAAIERLKRLVDLDPDVTIAVHALTNRYLQTRRYQEALEFNRQLLEQNPDSEAAAFNLGRAYNQLRRTEEAIEAYLRALSLNPERAATYHNLGVAYINKKEFVRAIEILEQAIKLQPNLADPYVNLGLAHFLSQHPEQAVANLKKAIDLEPENIRAHDYLGNVYLRMGRTEQGQAEVRLAQELKKKYQIQESQ